MLCEYRITVGTGEDRHGNRINTMARNVNLATVRKAAAEVFGGYTVWQTRGGWINKAGRLVEEPGVTIAVIVTDQHAPYAVHQFAQHCGYWFNQQSVMLVRPDGSADFIEVEHWADEPNA